MELSFQTLEKIRKGTINVKKLRKENLERYTDKIAYIGEPIAYEEFFLQHLLPNRPCVLGSWATTTWRSRQEWVGADGLPDTAYLRRQFGSTVVPVADCGQIKFSAQPKEECTLEQYLQYLQERSEQNPADESQCLYLKDWHFTRSHPHYEAYQTPVFFRSDWLNEFWDMRSDAEDDYRFVYFGPKGSWTPLHADVLRSYSWSANICGTKRWWLFPPGEEEKLKDTFGNLAYDLRSEELKDARRFPRYPECTAPLEVTQHTGEIIFVPSGWHHQVFNLEDTISINHNWLNGCSVDLSWTYIKASLQEVQLEIADCRDMDAWNQQCQLILKASAGIDYTEFYHFLRLIANNRIQFATDVARSASLETGPVVLTAKAGEDGQGGGGGQGRNGEEIREGQVIGGGVAEIGGRREHIGGGGGRGDIGGGGRGEEIRGRREDIEGGGNGRGGEEIGGRGEGAGKETGREKTVGETERVGEGGNEKEAIGGAETEEIRKDGEKGTGVGVGKSGEESKGGGKGKGGRGDNGGGLGREGAAHAIFDLLQIIAVLEDMLRTEEFMELDYTTFEEDPNELCARIRDGL